ncbi:MAG: biopolymer transporter ExbD [Deltaproteobacteria bacterium]|nr:biopolymer transporter ExbD [Deltaproteobacteria bacterium]
MAEKNNTAQAKLSDVKRIIRRILKKQEEEGVEETLNIYPMMDMMTILLVFMIMQFSASSADIVQSAELQIPTSTSTAETDQYLSIIISSSEIVVEGKHVISLRAGKVDSSLKQGGSNGWLITPLFKNLQQHRDRLKMIAMKNTQRPFRGRVRIIADKRTPFRTLGEVIYSLGQSEFGSVRFIVLQEGQS